jgi:DNA-binding response OmpR family regulator
MERKIAIVDDDPEIAHIESLTLKKEGYLTEVYPTGQSFLDALAKAKPALVILDLMLPDIDGLTILKKLRGETANQDIDVIIVSAKGMVSDKVQGLDLGADDYLEKPFSTLELASRVNARFRKKKEVEEPLVFHGFTMDEKAHSLLDPEKNEVALTQTEWDLLAFFLHHPNEAISRENLFNALWGTGDYESRALDVHIASLRKKLNDSNAQLIETIYGLGYRLSL